MKFSNKSTVDQNLNSCNRKRKSELIAAPFKNRGNFSVKTRRAIFSSHSIVKTRLVKMSDKIIAKMSDEKIVENHNIITVEHELHIKGQVF